MGASSGSRRLLRRFHRRRVVPYGDVKAGVERCECRGVRALQVEQAFHVGVGLVRRRDGTGSPLLSGFGVTSGQAGTGSSGVRGHVHSSRNP